MVDNNKSLVFFIFFFFFFKFIYLAALSLSCDAWDLRSLQHKRSFSYTKWDLVT